MPRGYRLAAVTLAGAATVSFNFSCRSPSVDQGREEVREFDLSGDFPVPAAAPMPELLARRFCRFVDDAGDEISRRLNASSFEIAALACDTPKDGGVELRIVDARHGNRVLAGGQFPSDRGLAYLILVLDRSQSGSIRRYSVKGRRATTLARFDVPSLATDWMKDHVGRYEWFPFGQEDTFALEVPDSWDGKLPQRRSLMINSSEFIKVLRWFPEFYDDPALPPEDERAQAPVLDVELRLIERYPS